MKVILKQKYENLGAAGSVVSVKGGFARNFLIPRDIAVPATDNNLKKVEHDNRTLLAKRQKEMKRAEEMRESLKKISCSISKKVGDQDKLFGAVTQQDIQEALKAEGFVIDKKRILLDEPIKTLGVYTIKLQLFDDVLAETKVWVVRQ